MKRKSIIGIGALVSIKYPFWENDAKQIEDISAVLIVTECVAIILAIFVIIFIIYNHYKCML